MKRLSLVAGVSLGVLLLIQGCALPNGDPAVGADANNSHTTAASGFGLGPEDFNTNGGAFGPDQLDH